MTKTELQSALTEAKCRPIITILRRPGPRGQRRHRVLSSFWHANSATPRLTVRAGTGRGGLGRVGRVRSIRTGGGGKEPLVSSASRPLFSLTMPAVSNSTATLRFLLAWKMVRECQMAQHRALLAVMALLALKYIIEDTECLLDMR